MAAIIVQQDCRTVRVSQKQVCAAITIKVCCEQSARRAQFYGAQTDFGGYVFESVLTHVAEQPDFSASIFCFTDGCQIDPAIIVVIQRSQSPGSPPIFDWKLDLLHALAVHVAPQGNPWRAIVGQSHVHPAILVKVQSNGCRDWWQLGQIPHWGSAPFAFARIQKKLRLPSSEDHVNRAIIVELSLSYPERRRIAGET